MKLSQSLQAYFSLVLAMESVTDVWHQRVYWNRMTILPSIYDNGSYGAIIPKLLTIKLMLFLIRLQYQSFTKLLTHSVHRPSKSAPSEIIQQVQIKSRYFSCLLLAR